MAVLWKDRSRVPNSGVTGAKTSAYCPLPLPVRQPGSHPVPWASNARTSPHARKVISRDERNRTFDNQFPYRIPKVWMLSLQQRRHPSWILSSNSQFSNAPSDFIDTTKYSPSSSQEARPGFVHQELSKNTIEIPLEGTVPFAGSSYIVLLNLRQIRDTGRHNPAKPKPMVKHRFLWNGGWQPAY